MSQVLASITLKDGSDADRVFNTSAKDTGYQKYTFIPAAGRLIEATTVAMKHTQPTKPVDSSEIKDRVIVYQPVFDAEGNALEPNVIDLTISTRARSTAADKADLLAALVSFLGLTGVKDQIVSGDNQV